MNSNAPAILRALIVYAICVPLAIFVGYTLANPLDYSSLGFFGVLLAILASPILLRWHYPLLLFSWYSSVTFAFLPGKPSLWLFMTVVSLSLSILERILNNRMHFIRVPQITWPLLVMLGVVFLTAELTGGFGLKALGSSVYGGKKYVFLVLSIFSYFALTSRPIPLEKAKWFVALFFLGRATAAIGDFYPIAPSWLNPLFYIFPPSSYDPDNPFVVGVTRLGGIGAAALGLYFWMMAKYGIRGIFLSGKPWRPALLLVFFVLVFLGGFRTALFAFVLVFIMKFFMEGLHRTPLILVFGLIGLMGCVALVPLAHKLPYTFQRTLAFLPLDLEADAKASADDSVDWRIRMWTALLPQVPKHLLLGEGYAFSSEEYNEMMSGGVLGNTTGNFDAAQNPLALAGDYHNGMLAVILPFGIWGVLVVYWFLGAALRVMYRNFKYGNPALRNINGLLFILFFSEAGSFASCFGGQSLAGEMSTFISCLGLSIALNNGICAPGTQTAQNQNEDEALKDFSHLRPALQR
jgi:O-Antigen ligase